jgi:sirohydrochlorin ferrochelatase
MTALVVFAHGSPLEDANNSVRALTAAVAERGRYSLAETAFLDCAPPDLKQAVAGLAERGATRIIVVPFFLTLGLHMQRDLPGIVDELRRTHGGVAIEVTAPMEGHPALVDIVLGRAEEAVNGGSSSGSATR